MNTKWSWVQRRVGLGGLSIGLVVSGAALGGVLTSTRGAEPGEPDRSAWQLQQADDAIARARDHLGLTEQATVAFSASVVTLEKDNTPFLSQQLCERPLWHVVILNWSFEIESYPTGYKDLYVRTADVYVDPLSGYILKLRTRWPPGIPEMAPEVSAAAAATQMADSSDKRYHGFPSSPPTVSFLEALDAIWRLAGTSPMRAKQVVGLYVMWSNLGQEPKAVWAIMLRGVPVKRPLTGTPPDAQTQYTYIIDAQSGAWIVTSSTPSPKRSP